MLECLTNLPWHEILMRGVITSVIASLIFLFFLFMLRPKVKISKNIAFDGERFIIKVVNLSWFRLYDVEVELTHKSVYQVLGGTNTKNANVNLSKYKRLSIPGAPFLFWNRDDYAGFAILYSTKDNLRAMFDNNGDYLEFTFRAKHGLSSFTKIVTEPHTHKSTIKDGEFMHGMNIDININAN